MPEVPLTEEQEKVATCLDAAALQTCIRTALDAIIEAPLCKPFMQPVDNNLFPDYNTLIKRPMDLGTIQERLPDYANAQGHFTLISIREIAADVRLVWSNCFKYNEEHSDIFRDARVLSTAFEASMRAEFTACVSSASEPSQDGLTAQSCFLHSPL